METVRKCPHCGGYVMVTVINGIHHYICTNPKCGATTTFVGQKFVGISKEGRIYEAENHLERYNRRAHEKGK